MMAYYTCPRNNWIEQNDLKLLSTDLEGWSASAEARVLHRLHHLADSCELRQPLAHNPMETTCKRHQCSQLCYVTSAQTSQCRQNSQLFFLFLPVEKTQFWARVLCVGNGNGMEWGWRWRLGGALVGAPATGKHHSAKKRSWNYGERGSERNATWHATSDATCDLKG